jgi:hypothetical protein
LTPYRVSHDWQYAGIMLSGAGSFSSYQARIAVKHDVTAFLGQTSCDGRANTAAEMVVNQSMSATVLTMAHAPVYRDETQKNA